MSPYRIHHNLTNHLPISRTQTGHRRIHKPTHCFDGMRRGLYSDTSIISIGIFALKVRGDSMETEFHEGDIIVINPYLKP